MSMQGSFVRKRGTSWTAYYHVAGGTSQRGQRSKGGFRTKAEAQAWLTTTLNSVITGDYVETIKLTFADYIEQRWLPTIEHSIRPTTFASYQQQLRLHALPRIGKLKLQELRADHLDQMYAALLKDGRKDGRPGGLSPKTVRYLHTTIHKALKDAERKGLVSRNVASAADPPKQRQSGEHEIQTWTAEEVRTFLNAIAGHRSAAGYFLAATTGMRRGEVLGLRWRDIDFENRRIAVRQTVTTVNYKVQMGRPKTFRGRRNIAIDAGTIGVLEKHRVQQDEEKSLLGDGYSDQDLVFAKVDGSPLNPDYFSQLFDRTVAKLPVTRIRLHDLRHTHATLGLAAGVPAKIMSDRLGHATVAFTQDVYMHAIPQLESQAADRIVGLLFGAGDFD